MFNVSDRTKRAWLLDSTEKVLSVNIGGSFYDESSIIEDSLILKETVMEEGNVDFVGMNSSVLELEMLDITPDLVGKWIFISTCCIDEQGQTDYVPIFRGIIDSIIRGGYKRSWKITAFNYVTELANTDITGWYNSIDSTRDILTFDVLWDEFLNAFPKIKSAIDGRPTYPFSWRFGTMSAKFFNDFKVEMMTALDFIKLMCQLNGGWGFLDHNGYFKVNYPDSQASITIPYYRSLDFEAYTVEPYDGVIISNTDSLDYTTSEASGDATCYHYGTCDNPYIIKANAIAYLFDVRKQFFCEQIYNIVKNFTYRPFQSLNNGLPFLECGDKVILTTLDDGVEVQKEFTVLSRQYTGTSICKDTFVASGEQIADISTNGGSVVNQCFKNQSQINVIKVDLSGKMNKVNPTGSGSISINRRSGSSVGNNSVAIGNDNSAIGDNSVAIGYYNQTNQSRSYAFGDNNKTNASNDVLVGNSNETGYAGYSGLFGLRNTANNHSYGFGENNIVNTNTGRAFGFAFGNSNNVNGSSYAIGDRIISSDGQMAIGKYNNDSNINPFVVGIGTPSSRKNGFWIDTDGKCYALEDFIAGNHKLSDKANSSDLGAVAFSNNYNDLDNLPTIPDEVSWNQLQTSGTKIAEVTIGGVPTEVYAPNGGGGGGSSVVVTPTLTSGSKIADISVDGDNKELYAPNEAEKISYIPPIESTIFSNNVQGAIDELELSIRDKNYDADIDGIRGNVNAWDSTISYSVGMLCIDHNILWECIVANQGINPYVNYTSVGGVKYWGKVDLSTLRSRYNNADDRLGSLESNRAYSIGVSLQAGASVTIALAGNSGQAIVMINYLANVNQQTAKSSAVYFAFSRGAGRACMLVPLYDTYASNIGTSINTTRITFTNNGAYPIRVSAIGESIITIV